MQTKSAGVVIWVGLERLKALCIVGMLIAHGFYWTGTNSGQVLVATTDPIYALIEMVGLVVGNLPVLLPFCAGIASRWRLTDEQLNALSLRHFVITAIILYSCNCLMNWGAGGYGVIWAWNVLALVAVGYLLLGLFLRIGVSAMTIGIIALMLLFVGDPLREALNIKGSDPDYLRIMFGDPRDWHSWPLFPWLATFFLGFTLGEFRLRWGAKRIQYVFLAIALLLLVLAAGNAELGQPFDPGEISGPELMVPPAIRVLGLLGIALMLLVILDWGSLFRYGPVRCFSAGILPIYMAHLIVGHNAASAFPISLRQQWLAPELGMNRLLFLLAVPMMLFVFSWLVGFLWLVITQHRFHIHLRRLK